MATFTKRGSRWAVQVRRKGSPALNRTFATRVEAKAWATTEEARIERCEQPLPRQQLAAVTLGDIIDRYRLEVTPTKRGASSEEPRLKKMRHDEIAAITLLALSSAHIARYRDRRLGVVKPATVRRELAIIQHALNVARRDWGYGLVGNPVMDIKLPKPARGRERRLNSGEFDRLLREVSATQNAELPDIVLLAIETGLRRGEILNLSWQHIDMDLRTAHVPETKTGIPRTIPLTDAAIRILRSRSPSTLPSVFTTSGNAVRLAWGRAVKRANLPDLRFHDLRHEAVSRFFELGLSLPEVAVISGHRVPRMLFRYTHLKADDLANKLRGRSWSSPARHQDHKVKHPVDMA